MSIHAVQSKKMLAFTALWLTQVFLCFVLLEYILRNSSRQVAGYLGHTLLSLANVGIAYVILTYRSYKSNKRIYEVEVFYRAIAFIALCIFAASVALTSVLVAFFHGSFSQPIPRWYELGSVLVIVATLVCVTTAVVGAWRKKAFT
ncbi:MAG TPA: hypothetical protein VEA59_01400 [Patescibacteria group bacterium]|nr:hypothetical protein [Patescibacteria group bacterium]